MCEGCHQLTNNNVLALGEIFKENFSASLMAASARHAIENAIPQMSEPLRHVNNYISIDTSI